jgi:hypothetical protein
MPEKYSVDCYSEICIARALDRSWCKMMTHTVTFLPCTIHSIWKSHAFRILHPRAAQAATSGERGVWQLANQSFYGCRSAGPEKRSLLLSNALGCDNLTQVVQELCVSERIRRIGMCKDRSPAVSVCCTALLAQKGHEQAEQG